MINKTYFGDCREQMKKLVESGVKVQTCVTSPPYWGLRDYGVDGQLGGEETPQYFIKNLVEVFSHVWDLLEDDGTLWLNLGDSYAGSGKGSNPDGTVHRSSLLGKQGSNKGAVIGKKRIVKSSAIGLKNKDLIMIPARVAIALQEWGWYLRQDIIWNKPNPMPESVKDRCTSAHEHIFLLSKKPKYYFDNEAIKELANPDSIVRDRENTRLNKVPGRSKMQGLKTNNYETRNKRNVWTVSTKPYSGAHFAVFPPELIEPCILAGSRVGDIVFDPFMGSGTTAQVAQNLGRNWIGCELNEDYGKLQKQRTSQQSLVL